MSRTKEDLLFYSDHCQFSKYVVSLCLKHNLKDYFLFVCVDTNIGKIPDFVDRVPLIYRSRRNEIIYDDDIEKFIQIIAQTSTPTRQQVQQQAQPVTQQPQEILPFTLSQNVNYSDNFSFLAEEDGAMESHKQYTLLGMDDRMMAMPSNDEEGKSNKFDEKLLDQYMQTRDLDTANFKQKMNNGLQPIVR